MGGRGAGSGMSNLEAFKENARQFNQALQTAKQKKASVVEFTDITGNTVKRYWNGATYTDRASSLYEKEFKGTYKSKAKLSKKTKKKSKK